MAGRKKRVFSEEEITLIEGFALDNSKSETIASALNIPVNTLKRHFGRKMREMRAKGKLALKHYQQLMAKNNSQMAIWLGKQDLEQVDKQTVLTTSEPPIFDETEHQALKEMCNQYKLRLSRGQGQQPTGGVKRKIQPNANR